LNYYNIQRVKKWWAQSGLYIIQGYDFVTWRSSKSNKYKLWMYFALAFVYDSMNGTTANYYYYYYYWYCAEWMEEFEIKCKRPPLLKCATSVRNRSINKNTFTWSSSDAKFISHFVSVCGNINQKYMHTTLMKILHGHI
jgi:hypothetical protein